MVDEGIIVKRVPIDCQYRSYNLFWVSTIVRMKFYKILTIWSELKRKKMSENKVSGMVKRSESFQTLNRKTNDTSSIYH